MYVKARAENDPLYNKARKAMKELERTAVDEEEVITLSLTYHDLKKIERLTLLDAAFSDLTFHSIDRGRHFARDISVRKGKEVAPIREFGGGGLVLNEDFEAEDGIPEEGTSPETETQG